MGFGGVWTLTRVAQFTLFWVTEYLLPSNSGEFIALQITSMVLGMSLAFSGAYNSKVPEAVENKFGQNNVDTVLWVSLALTFAVVFGVVVLGASTESILVAIIGEIPIISFITAFW